MTCDRLQLEFDTLLRLESPGDAFAEADKVERVQSAKDYMKRMREADKEEMDEEKKRRPKKIQRLASFRHAVAMDCMLQAAQPRGISAYLPQKDDDRKPMLSLPTWVNNEDYGPVPWSTRTFLQYHLQLRQLASRDFMHVLWRSMLGGIGQAGLKSILYMSAIGHSLASGPWEGAAWYHQVVDASKEYFQRHTKRCPLFETLLPRMMRDLKRTGDEVNDDVIEQVRHMMFDAKFLDERGPRSQMSRWAAWMDSEEWWSGQITFRLLFMMYLGLEMGYLQHDKSRSMVINMHKMAKAEDTKLSAGSGGAASSSGAAAAPEGAEPAAKAPMSADKASVQKIRDTCKNTMHACTLIYSCERFTEGARMILAATKPYRTTMSHWRHVVRDRECGLKFGVDQASGKSLLDTIWQSFQLWGDGEVLEGMGCVVSGLAADKRWQKATLDGCECMAQDQIARQFGVLLESLGQTFLQNFSEACVCYPRKFAEFADKDLRQAALNKFRGFVEAHETAQDQKDAFWKKMCRRSCMNLTLTKDYAVRCKAAEWKDVPTDVLEHTRRCHSQFQGTTITEDSFHYIKSQGGDRTTSCQAWAIPSQVGMLGEKYKYREADRNTWSADDGIPIEKIADSVYRPSSRRSEPRLREITERATWPTFWPPENYHIAAEELLFTKWAHDQKCHEKAPAAWRSKCMLRGLVLRCGDTGVIYFCFGCALIMATLWPMEVTRVGKHEFLSFKKITSMEGLRFTPLLDFDQFKGIPTRWISPLHQFILNGSKPMKKQVATPLLITGPDTSLLNMLADRGFGTLKGGLIKRILESEYAQEVPETWSSADQVVQLVKIVKKCSDLEAAEILLGRAAGVDDHEAEQELLGSELVQDCLQASDRKEVHEFLQTSADDIAFTKELKTCIKAIRKKKGVKKRNGG